MVVGAIALTVQFTRRWYDTSNAAPARGYISRELPSHSQSLNFYETNLLIVVQYDFFIVIFSIIIAIFTSYKPEN
jgi:hypothetical protein